MASELLAVGVDFSFAPVLDLDDCRCNVIANRAFSPDPQEAIHLASAWMKGMHDAGMATTGKHFPGHGSVTVDSHVELPIDQREFSVIAAHDLLPFAALISQLDAVMPAHILFSVVDSKQPVGFSEYWLKTILRCDLGFTGVIFSDDLSMAGAAVGGSFAERAALALDAGCDMVLVCNNRAGAIEVVAGVGCGSPKSQNRLLSMRAREQVSWDHLKSNPRWQLSAHLLAGIIGDH
jgi:beta-N-acetylhexosaminidase